MLEYKPRIRNDKLVTSWIPTSETKNRGIVSPAEYYPPIEGEGFWTKRSGLAGSPWNAAAPKFGGGKWLGGHEYGAPYNGRLITSTDGITWSVQTSGIDLTCLALAYGNGLWVQVGLTSTSQYRLYTSTNGTTWTLRSSAIPSSSIFNYIKYINGTWYAVGATSLNMRIWSSTDAITWTLRYSLPISGGGSFQSLDYQNGIFMAVGSYQNLVDYPIIVTSTNGTSWTTITPPSLLTNRQPRSISAGNGVWAIATPGGGGSDDSRRVLFSTDNGATWNPRGPVSLNGYSQVVYGAGLFMAKSNQVDYSIVAFWNAGLSWTTQSLQIGSGHVGNNGNFWVAAGWINNPFYEGISTSTQGFVSDNGLVLNVDAANITSYPRYGTLWYDISGNNNVGTFVRNVTWQSSNSGRMNIDGSTKSYISFPNTSSLQFGSTFTIQAWIRPTYMGARHSIFSTRLNGNSGGFSFECGTNEAGTNRIGVSGVGTWIYRSQNNVVALNAWTNVCYVRNGSSQAMYVNGELISPASTAAYNITNNAANKTIGIGNIETTEFFGQIAKVLVYNRALDAQDIKDNYLIHKSIYQP